MICLECDKLDLQKYPQHARNGFGKCSTETVGGTFVSFAYRRDCGGFMPANAGIAQKRIEWWKGK